MTYGLVIDASTLKTEPIVNAPVLPEPFLLYAIKSW
jgi:hypothetical protein